MTGLVLGFLLSLLLIFVVNKQSFGWTVQFSFSDRISHTIGVTGICDGTHSWIDSSKIGIKDTSTERGAGRINMTKCKRFLSSTLALASLLVGTVTSPSPCDARQFTQALPGYKFSFPRDHASHDDYRTEWWYFTGHLNVDDNEKSGALGDKANNNKTPNHY